jgi:FkbM family methyltransferase
MDNIDIINMSKLVGVIKNNGVLVDVGANVGDYTHFFLKNINDDGKVYAIELSSETCNILNTKFRDNKNVTILNNAVSDNNDVINYYGDRDNICMNNIIGYDMYLKENKVLGQVKAITLDELLKDEELINLIKIDVEGAELLVLKGMYKTIDKVEFLLVECHLDEDWDTIRNILLNDFKLSCENYLENTEITMDSKRPYQCFCKKIK